MQAQKMRIVEESRKGRGLVTAEMKLERLQDSVAQKLFATMPDKIVAAVERAFIADDTDGEDAKKIWKYLTYESFVARAIDQRPGSGLAYYYLYNKFMPSAVDKYFCDCPAGNFTHNRLEAIKREMPGVLRDKFADQEKIIAYNVGSAQGYDMIEVLHQHPDLAEKCYVYNIDPDEVALAQGWERIVQYSLEDCFELVPQPLQEVPRRNVDFIVASGIFCPKTMRESDIVMKRMMMPHLRKGGVIMYNATVTDMIVGDPLCDFFMRIGGWPMHYKSIDDTMHIADKAKLKYLSHFCDEGDYNCCVFAQK